MLKWEEGHEEKDLKIEMMMMMKVKEISVGGEKGEKCGRQNEKRGIKGTTRKKETQCEERSF